MVDKKTSLAVDSGGKSVPLMRPEGGANAGFEGNLAIGAKSNAINMQGYKYIRISTSGKIKIKIGEFDVDVSAGDYDFSLSANNMADYDIGGEAAGGYIRILAVEAAAYEIHGWV